MKNSLRWLFVAIGVLLLAVFFCPYPSTTAPAWRVEIVDENGRQIPNIRVKQAWQFFDVDIAEWEDYRVADSHGRAAFPRRVTWASLARRASMGDEKGLGPSFFIQACDETHLEEAKLFWDGNRYWNPAVHKPESQLVAKPVRECGEID